MIGHLLGAAGAVESIATILALHHRVVPPTINVDKPDEKIELDIATEQRKLGEGDLAALNSSFGFGGLQRRSRSRPPNKVRAWARPVRAPRPPGGAAAASAGG